MQKIKDERLIMKNLKNIRIAFIVQSLGIMGILLYEAITKGISSMTSQPLWLVFMVTVIVMLYLNLSISVDYEKTEKQLKTGSYYKIVLVSLGIALVVGFLVKLNPESGLRDGAIIGTVIFFCTLAPYSVVYYLRKKRAEEVD